MAVSRLQGILKNENYDFLLKNQSSLKESIIKQVGSPEKADKIFRLVCNQRRRQMKNLKVDLRTRNDPFIAGRSSPLMIKNSRKRLVITQSPTSKVSSLQRTPTRQKSPGNKDINEYGLSSG